MTKPATEWMVTPLKRYADFSGRACRAEYWWFTLFAGLASMVAGLVDFTLIGLDRLLVYGAGPVSGLLALALIIPSIAVSFRRLHDTDRSAWWLLLGLLPLIGGLVLLVWYVSRGTAGDNRFGPDPLRVD